MGQFSDQFNAVVDSAQNPQANANLTAGVSSNPDAVATNLQLGRRFGVHPDVVAAMQDDFKQRAASEDAQVQVADAPKTAAYIAADPVRAQVSHDDVGILGTLENTLEGYGQSMLNHFGMAVNALRGVATNPTTGIDIAKNAPAALVSGAVSQAAGFAGAAKLAGDASGAVDYTQGIQQRLFGGTVEGKMSSYFGAKATSLAGEAAALAPNPTGNYVADQSLGMVQSLPGVVVALGGGMGARAMGWSAEAAASLGALSMGIPSAGGFYQKATDAGVSPLKAGIGAVAEGAAMTAAGYAGELPFIKATDAGAPLIMRYLQSQVPEQIGMQGANLVNQFTDWLVLPENKDKTVGDFLESLPASAATTAIQVGALGAITNFGAAGVERALGTAGHQARLDAAAAADTGAMHDGIKNIMDLAAQSKTRERDPASFQQFMQAQVEDGPLEHVYVDGKTLAQTLSDAGPEGADLAARLPSVQEQLSEAAASGGEVRIPTAELATALPGHALEQKILGDIRVDPLADSANESKVKQDEAVDRTQQAFEKELQVSADDNAFQRSRDNVVQGFVNKLGDTGRFTRDVNQKYGQLLGDFYATQAQRLGIAPEEMAARYPLDIKSQLSDPSPDEQQTNQDHPDARISTRAPSTKGAAEDPLDNRLEVGLEPIARNPKVLAHNVELMANYPGMKVDRALPVEQQARQIIDHIKDNLLHLHDSVPPETAARAKQWYDGANAIAEKWSDDFGVTPETVAGVIAAMSPQKDWYQNVSLAERVLDITHGAAGHAYDDTMRETAARIFADPKFKASLDELEGKTLNQLSDAYSKAMFVRIYDQAHNPRGYRISSPEGGFEGPAEGNVAWGSMVEIAKAVGVIEAGTREANSELMGTKHKVRSFYNNIIAPNAGGDVTIDTHAVAAGLLRPLSGSDAEVYHNFGSSIPTAKNPTGVPNAKANASAGAEGTYGFYAEAYREAAKERGILPREMQSITWEAARGLFQPKFKANKNNVAAVNDLWNAYGRGDATLEETRSAVEKAAGGIEAPSWDRPSDLSSAEAAASSYEGELPQVRLSRRNGPDEPGVAGSAPLVGLPRNAVGPLPQARGAALDHMTRLELPYNPPSTYVKVDPARAERIAQAFETMKHDPSDPLVKASYDAMIAETLSQWDTIKKTGLKVEFIDGPDPYGNPRNAILDVHQNNHLWVFPTSDGFGSSDLDVSDNPLLQTVTGETISGRAVQANDIFRIVHDYFGHIKEGVGFRADGEENAWRSHSSMYSPLARRAMTTETRGQNSWVNYGPHGETNRTAGPGDTVYAPQKIGLLPEWVSEEGARDPREGKQVVQQDVKPFRDAEGNARELSEGELKRAALASNAEKHIRGEGISATKIRRAADGTILAGVEPFYQNDFHMGRLQARADALGERIGQTIRMVPEDDPRFAQAYDVSHQAPPVDENGMVQLQHFGPEGLTRTDPSKWGTNFNILPPSERARLGTDLGRTYFGIATGEPGGYINEFGSAHAYVGEVPAPKLYDIMGDPDGIRTQGTGGYERAIKDAGYSGYWVKNGELGLVGTMFDPVDVRPAPALEQQRAAQQARGSLTFGNDVTKQPSTITLNRNADLSTFLHESGHFFLEVMSHMAASPDAPQSVKDDFAKTLKFMGTDAATWAGSDFEAKREGHEKFARGFEAYLFEGKAPSEGMRGVFQHFKSWLVSVYRNNINNLRVKLNPDIRGVFDRLIASDDAIKAAEGEAGLIAQFPTKPDAMSDAEWSDYQKLGDAAHQTAADSLQTASIRDMRFASRAKDEALKRLQGEVAEKRAAVESEVRGEIESKPVYRAQDYMRRGVLDGEKQDGPTKMSRPELKAQYQLADDAFWNDLKGMTSTENGVHPMQIAELFGFGSVDEMIRALRSAPDRKELIDGETDSRMLERYGDITSPQALDRAASAAIHNEVRGRMVATELREGQKALLAGHTNENGNPSARVLAKAAKRYAEGVVSRLKVRDVRPAQFEGAERRAAAAATKALSKGDSQGFVTEKRNQLLNFHLVREARGAQDTIQKTIDYFRKFAKPGTRDAIDRSYLDQIDGMLDRFDFRTGVTDKALAARKTLASWVEAQRALGLEPNIDPAMENEANRQSYKDMTMDELKGLRDSVKNIEHLGRLKDKLLKNKAERDLGVVADAVRNGIIEKSYGTEREQPFGAKTWAQKAKQGVFEVLTTLRKLSSLAREMDGNEDGGPVWEHLIRPLNDASVDEQARLIDATTKLKKIFADMGDRRPWVSEYEPAIGQSLTHEGRLMMALNWGNDLNRQRLMDGNHLTQDQVEGALAKLSKQDWDFVQGVWRHIDSHWGDISAQALRMDGVAPEKQEGVQFAQKSADGHDLQIDGGYFPLKYDADKDGKIDAYKDADIAQAMTRAAFTRSTTRRGFLKERAEKVEHPLRLDFGVIFQHHAEVIHDLAYRETLTDANRVLGRVDGAIRQHYGPEVARAFKKTYEDIAAGSMGARNAYDKGIAYLRSGVTTAGIAWNVWTGVFHLTGFANSVARVGVGNAARGVARFFGDASKMTLTSNWVYDQSDYMKQRATTQSKHLSELSNRYDAKGPIGSQIARIPGSAEAGEFLHRSFHAFIDRALRITSVPTWSGAYLDAVDKGEQHERAVAIADQAVRDSHGDGDMQNTAEAMRSKGVTSLFTSFMMWFSTAYNQMTESNKLAVKNPSPTTIAKAASDFLLIAIAPAATLSVLHGLYNGDDKKKIAHKVEGEVAGGLLSFFPYLRELSPVVAAGVSGEPVRDYQGPAGTRFIQALTEAAKQMQHDGLTAKLLPSANAALGVLFHYPAAQVQRTASGVMALADGKTKNPTAIMFGPPPKK